MWTQTVPNESSWTHWSTFIRLGSSFVFSRHFVFLMKTTTGIFNLMQKSAFESEFLSSLLAGKIQDTHSQIPLEEQPFLHKLFSSVREYIQNRVSGSGSSLNSLFTRCWTLDKSLYFCSPSLPISKVGIISWVTWSKKVECVFYVWGTQTLVCFPLFLPFMLKFHQFI